MKIVLDTNVLVSGLLNPFGPPGQIVKMVSSGSLQLCFDLRILTEYRQVLARKAFGFDSAAVAGLLGQVQPEGTMVSSEPLKKALPDPADEVFLEVVIASQASCLVTGNLKHFPPSLRAGVSVLSPREFLETYRGKSPS